MAQIPLTMVGRLPAIKNNPLAGNVLFWLGLLSGFPLLSIAYVRPRPFCVGANLARILTQPSSALQLMY